MTPPPVPTATATALRSLSALGAAAGAVAVLAAGRVGPPGWSTTFTTWAGTWSQHGVLPMLEPGPGRLLALALLTLAAAFAGLLRVTSTRPVGAVAVARVGAWWALPLVVGPPMLSNDVYSYVAQGSLVARGLDPTRVSPFALGSTSSLLHAVDPMWRGTVSPYGPLATLLQGGAVRWAAGDPTVAVLVFRLVALAGVAVAAWALLTLHRRIRPGGDREGRVVALVWANPLLLLHLVSAAHLEALVGALLALALLLAHGGGRAGRVAAVVLATAAAAVKLPALLVVGVLVLATGAAGARALARRAAAAGGLVVVTWAALTWWAGSGGDPLAAVSTPAAGRTLVAPGVLLADLLTPLRWAGFAGDDALLATGRALAAGAGLVLLVLVLRGARRRPVSATAGLGLLVVAAAGPVLYPWYLAWGLPLLAVTARGRVAGRLGLLSAVGSVLCIQGLTRTATYVVVAVVVLAAGAWWWRIDGDAVLGAVRRAARRTPVPASPAPSRRGRAAGTGRTPGRTTGRA